MSFLGLWLGAVGLADLTMGLAGSPASRGRVFVAAGTGGLVAGVGAALVGHSAGVAVLSGIGGLLLVLAWAWLRAGSWSNARIGSALALHGATVAVLASISVLAPATDGGLFGRWLENLPFLGDTDWETGVLVAGVFVWLAATANSIVRMVIFLVEKKIELTVGEEQLKGGRIIGPLERWLIFSLVLTGNAVAAGFITAAKSLARFPELGQSADIKLDTEYLLVGSLVSWSLALAPLALVP